ncbi:transposase [Microcoleus sp. FACHB-672]|nr:transposase [Microcoleus sp. FACHB-672]
MNIKIFLFNPRLSPSPLVSGTTGLDWFFGFKLHLVCNDLGELLNMAVTAGTIDDRKPVLTLLKGLSGKVIAD